MLKYFMRYKLGWWVLHVVAIGLTFYLGHMVNFKFYVSHEEKHVINSIILIIVNDLNKLTLFAICYILTPVELIGGADEGINHKTSGNNKRIATHDG